MDNRLGSIRAADRVVVTVSELTDRIKEIIEVSFPSVWVCGEVSNFSRPRSGHCYFTLKDESAQLRAVIWRNSASRLRFNMEDGLEAVCHGRVDLYSPRGSYQLIVDEIHPRGLGALELALRQLREKLSAEGLFAPERKKPLPRFPRRVAFVTSPTGAAVRDFLEVVRRRYKGVDVLIVPSRVQGDGASAEIAAGIRQVNQLCAEIDVIVVGRGGGSLEDLWCFNEEAVVRAIADSRIPVVSAVGHEIDVTLSDLAADLRALTPSEAAERIVPSAEQLREEMGNLSKRLGCAILHGLEAARLKLQTLAEHHMFRRPRDRIETLARMLDELEQRARRVAMQTIARKRQDWNSTTARLESLSPLAVLSRGYSLTMLAESGEIIRDADGLLQGQSIETRLGHGSLVSRIEKVRTNGSGPESIRDPSPRSNPPGC